jgi:hypothetical protein
MGSQSETKKIVSFSLWGNNPMYLKGVEANVKLAETYYPGFEVWVHHPFNYPFVQEITNAGATPVACEEKGPWHGLYWRFYPAADPSVDLMMSRDLDSRIGPREASAVLEWLLSDAPFHIIRDHRQHNRFIMGGMWGVRGGIITDMVDIINSRARFDKKGSDQEFLCNYIWPMVAQCHIGHVGNRGKKVTGREFTLPEINWEAGESFIGKVVL